MTAPRSTPARTNRSRHAYRACANCGQVVAHARDGRPLHMHRESAKCEQRGANNRGESRGRAGNRSPYPLRSGQVPAVTRG